MQLIERFQGPPSQHGPNLLAEGRRDGCRSVGGRCPSEMPIEQVCTRQAEGSDEMRRLAPAIPQLDRPRAACIAARASPLATLPGTRSQTA